MNKINVIDLDNTLISFDSFRSYTMNFLRKGDFLLALMILQKKMKVLSSDEFKKKITLFCRKKNRYNIFITSFSEYILQNTNEEILSKVKSMSDESTINILSSASPSDYVTLVAEKLGWESISTLVTNKNINHNYGKQKIINLLSEYPKEKYFYNYAISDSKSDLELLKLFNKYELIT